MNAVLFDWDGTVVDSWGPHVRAARAALETALGRPPDELEVERFLLAPDAASSGLQSAIYFGAWEAMQPLYRLAQSAVRPFPGIEDALDALHRSGTPLAVVTSKRRWAVAAEMRRLNLGRFFEAVICREDTSLHKPYPQPLLRALDEIDANHGVFIGDAQSDMAAARAARLPGIGAAWGWEGADRLMEQHPRAVCLSIDRLVDLISAVEERDLTSGRELG